MILLIARQLHTNIARWLKNDTFVVLKNFYSSREELASLASKVNSAIFTKATINLTNESFHIHKRKVSDLLLLGMWLVAPVSVFAEDPDCLPSLERPLTAESKTKHYLPEKLIPVDNYIREIGERLVANIEVKEQQFSFHLIDDDTVNAVSDRCGNIWISSGMLVLLNSESELAFVLGHEIGHVLLKHGKKRDLRRGIRSAVASIVAQVTSATGYGAYERRKGLDDVGLLMESGKFQEEELQADEAAAQYMVASEFDIEGALQATQLLKNQELFEFKRARLEGREPRVNKQFVASHPDNDERYKETIQNISGLPRFEESRQGREAFLRKLEGLNYGPSDTTSVQRGRYFYYPRLGLKMVLPTGWVRDHSVESKKVMDFVSPSKDAIFQLSSRRLSPRVPLESVATEEMGFQIREGRGLTIGGMPAYLAIADRVDTPYGTRPGRLLLLADQKKGILYVGIGAGQFDLKRIAADGDFIKIIFSMARMDRGDFPEAKPLQVQVVRAEEGTTFESLAELSDLPNYALDELRVINGLYPSGQPSPGQLIKIID